VVTVRLRVEAEEVLGHGWVVEVPEVGAVAQGTTYEEALANLRELIEHYPEVVDDLLAAAKARSNSPSPSGQ
jgi:predicted RNase H-like HicB family nuclease